MFSTLLAAICNYFTISDTFTLQSAIIIFFAAAATDIRFTASEGQPARGHLPETGSHV